jgi:SAM-dependent methyltransferase
MTDAVRSFYAGFGEREWGRLARPDDGWLEYTITTRVLEQYLPSGARVLDNGCGPGRYSLWLAERGHRVSLSDLTPELLTIARERLATSAHRHRIEEIIEADARDLRHWPEATFDAALALGPFYHLTDPAGRDAAAAELARVVVPGGVVFVALMPRLGFLRRVIATPAERHLLGQPGFIERILDEGVFINDRPEAFTGGYGVRPEEVAPFFARFGFQAITLLAAESFVPDLQGALPALAADHPEAQHAAFAALLRTAAEPSILGMANHLLYVGRRM